jgi:hypothetical protein
MVLMNTAVSAVAVASASAVAMPADAIHDPIFDLIERHRVAFLKFSASGTRQGELDSRETRAEHDEQERLTWRVYYADVKAIACEMTETIPTTTAGMIALLSYVLAFNDGALCHQRMPDHPLREWDSVAWMWPDVGDVDDDKEEEGTAFAWALLQNVIAFERGRA